MEKIKDIDLLHKLWREELEYIADLDPEKRNKDKMNWINVVGEFFRPKQNRTTAMPGSDEDNEVKFVYKSWDELKEYAVHKEDCEFPKECTCGLEDIMKE